MRNNALVVLFDLVKQHTILFDRHLPAIGLAAADRSPLVRHHAVMLLAQLLLEDYIKWRPALFRAFCLALVDTEDTQRALASSCTHQPLASSSTLGPMRGKGFGFTTNPQRVFTLNPQRVHP